MAASAELLKFADAVIGGSADELAHARDLLRVRIGASGLVDAAAVVAGFSGISRIADATGIPLEDDKAAATVELRAAMQLERFAATKW